MRRSSMAVIRRFASIAGVLGCVVVSLLAQEGRQPYRPKDPGIVAPVVIKDVKPQYTAEAREKKIQGVVELEAVVLEDGTVGDVTVTKSLDQTYGLDQASVDALKRWLFKPGLRDDKPVRVLVAVEMSFTLK
jgi:TonB family protein